MDEIHKRIALSAVFTGFAIILSIMLRPYASVDDWQIAIVTNGLYSTDSFCKHIHPLFCYFISFMHSCFSSLDFYLLFIRVIYCFSVFSLVYFLSYHGSYLKVILPFSVFIVSLSAVSVNYTVLTSFIIGCGMCLFFIDTNHRKTCNTFALAIIALGCLLRRQMVLLSLPFFVLELLFWDKRKFDFSAAALDRLHIRRSIALVFIIAVSFFSYSIIAHSVPGYLDGISYDDARTVIVDYPMRPYAEAVTALRGGGCSENDYISVRRLLLADTDRINTEFLKMIGTAGSGRSGGLSETITAAANETLQCMKSDAKCPLIVAFTFVLFVYSLLCDIQPVKKLKCVLAFLGSMFILCYFAIIGRIVDRLLISVLLLCIFSLMISIYDNGHEINVKRSRLLSVILVASLYLGAAGACAYQVLHIAHHYQMKNEYSVMINGSESSDIISTDDIYVWQVFDFDRNIARPYMELGKLPGSDILKHHVVYGDWTYGQVYMYEYLSNLGIPNPAKSLLHRPDTYYVAFDKDMMETYLQENFDENCKATDTGRTVYGVTVWSFQQTYLHN